MSSRPTFGFYLTCFCIVASQSALSSEESGLGEVQAGLSTRESIVDFEHKKEGRSGTFVSMRGRQLAFVDMSTLSQDPQSAILHAISTMTPKVSEPLEIQIVEMLPLEGEGIEIRFVQTINSNPVAYFNEISIDNEGFVKSFRGKFVNPSTVEEFVALGEDEARILAIEALKRQFNGTRIKADDKTRSQLFYRFVTDEHDVAPFWGFDGFVVDSEDEYPERYTVEVSVETLSIDIRKSGHNKSFIDTRVCKPITGQREQCDDYTQSWGWPPITITFAYDKIYSELTPGTRTCTEVISGSCGQQKFTSPWDVLQEVEDLLDTQLPSSICCGNVSDVDILVDANTATNASVHYRPGNVASPTATIVFPKAANLKTSVYNGQDPSTSADTTAHEFGHHVVERNNPNLYYSNDSYANQIEEALADVIAATYSKSKGQSDAVFSHLEMSLNEVIILIGDEPEKSRRRR